MKEKFENYDLKVKIYYSLIQKMNKILRLGQKITVKT